MKKLSVLLCSLLLCFGLFCLTGCGGTAAGNDGSAGSSEDSSVSSGAGASGNSESIENIGMVMVDGRLYYNTGKESSINARCGVMDGEIKSAVGPDRTPMEDNQSNFGTGYGYQRTGENQIEVLMDEQWIVFESVEKADGTSSLQ